MIDFYKKTVELEEHIWATVKRWSKDFGKDEAIKWEHWSVDNENKLIKLRGYHSWSGVYDANEEIPFIYFEDYDKGLVQHIKKEEQKLKDVVLKEEYKEYLRLKKKFETDI